MLWTLLLGQVQIWPFGFQAAHKPERQDGRPQQRRAPKGNKREDFMRISRRDLLLGSAGALGAATFSFPKPAIAQSEPIKIGCLAAMTGPSSAPTIGFNRGVNFAADAINAAGGVKGRKIEDHHARHPGRSDQGGQRHPGNDQPGQGPCDLGAAQFGRGACHHADHGARQDAGHPSLRGREPDRHHEISERVPHGAFEQPMGRCRPQLLPQYPQGEKGRRDRRHHGLWRDRGRCVGGGVQEGRRRSGLSGQHRCHPARHDARTCCAPRTPAPRSSWSGASPPAWKRGCSTPARR